MIAVPSIRREGCGSRTKGFGTAPFVVVLAAIVGFCKALFEILMGVIWVLRRRDEQPVRRHRLWPRLPRATRCFCAGTLGYWVTVILSALGATVALIYAFSGPNEFPVPGLVSAATNLAVIWLLFRPAARNYMS